MCFRPRNTDGYLNPLLSEEFFEQVRTVAAQRRTYAFKTYKTRQKRTLAKLTLQNTTGDGSKAHVVKPAIMNTKNVLNMSSRQLISTELQLLKRSEFQSSERYADGRRSANPGISVKRILRGKH